MNFRPRFLTAGLLAVSRVPRVRELTVKSRTMTAGGHRERKMCRLGERRSLCAALCSRIVRDSHRDDGNRRVGMISINVKKMGNEFF